MSLFLKRDQTLFLELLIEIKSRDREAIMYGNSMVQTPIDLFQINTSHIGHVVWNSKQVVTTIVN